MRGRLDDVLAAAAIAAVAVVCVVFRYLPMVDLPQHYAMVSILAHHSDPTYDFAQRYTFDFLGRPYATVYWLGAALAHVAPLGAAMRVVVALCTVAPFVGAHALLAATGRPRFWLLAAVPFAFGSLWHWGFLNFLLGTGLFLGGLALVVVASRRASRRASIALAVLSVVLFFTHFHGLAMLLLFAPFFAWAYKDDSSRPARVAARALGPLAPAAIAAAAFVLLTWRRAEGTWSQLDPGFMERVDRFPDFLAAGLPGPWPDVWIVAFVVTAALGVALGGSFPTGRARIALGVALVGQVAMYFVLPLNTNTATYVSARHALLCVLLVLPLLPALDGVRASVSRAVTGVVCLVALFVSARHVACFDREARDFDGVLAAMKPNKRVLPLVYDRTGACTHPTTFPYLHFAAYYQAARGGELARSFAVVWNVPIRYRSDYVRYPIREQLEWTPETASDTDVQHFDYLLVRGPRRPSLPRGVDVREVATSGAWTLLENPAAVPPELPVR